MSEFLLLARFLVDALLVAAGAWLALRAVRGPTTGLLEPLLGWGLMAVALVAGPGVGLGLAGVLGPVGFLMAHAGCLALLFGLRRKVWRDDLAAAREWLVGVRRFLAEPDWAARGAAGLILLVLMLAALAAVAAPLVADTLAYRLPRIGLWLAEGRLTHFATPDARLNYMPWVPDLCAAWLLGATGSGWSLVALTQPFGGVLLLGATIGLARQVGLGRGSAVGAAALLLGLANVAVQFTTPQTDLFTAGVLAAGFCLWQGAWLRGEGSVMGGLGAALALGSKGTVFYLAPGLLIIVGWLVVRHRRTWQVWRRTLAGAAVGTALFIVPWAWMNQSAYGGIFGPAEAVQLHHGAPDLGARGRLDKLWLNLRSSAVQLCDPHAQPAGLRDPARALGTILLQDLPEPADDPHAFLRLSRRYSLAGVLAMSEPDVDVLSCGLLAVVTFVVAVGTLLGSRPGPVNRPLVLAGAAAVVGYVLFQHAVVQWHVWAFRFMVIAAPWWAVTVAAGLAGWSPRWRTAGWILLGLAGASVCWHMNSRVPQAGWPALLRPESAPTHFVYQSWRRWSQSLGPATAPLQVALEANRPIAAFLRQAPARLVQVERLPAGIADTAESLVPAAGGWLITPLGRFMGREGRVVARTWLNVGPLGDDYSLAAYRRLEPGETPPPVLYANRRADTAQEIRRSLLVRTWDTGSVRLEFFNPRAEACRWLVITPEREYQGEMAAGGTAEAALLLPPGMLSEVVVVFRCPSVGPAPVVVLSAGAGPRPE
jgi:hypothetical protein